MRWLVGRHPCRPCRQLLRGAELVSVRARAPLRATLAVRLRRLRTLFIVCTALSLLLVIFTAVFSVFSHLLELLVKCAKIWMVAVIDGCLVIAFLQLTSHLILPLLAAQLSVEKARIRRQLRVERNLRDCVGLLFHVMQVLSQLRISSLYVVILSF